jgi:hypothetical protein
MKNLKFLVMLFLAISVLSAACKKDDDDNGDPSSGNYKGSASLTIDGTVHNVLQSDVAEITEGVVFLIQNSIDETTFQVAIANVPAIGETFTFTMNPPDDSPTLMLADGPVPNVIALMALSGTLERISEKVYEIDAVLMDVTNFTDEYPISGTVTVGVIDTK